MNALISGRAGIAVIFDGENVSSIHADEPDRVIPRRPSEVPYLLRKTEDFELVEDLGQSEIADMLVRERQRALALQLALYALDPNLSENARRHASVELNELMLSEARVTTLLEEVLFAHPLPSTGDLESALSICRSADAGLVLKIFERLSDWQPAIAKVRESWEAIPHSLLGDGEDFLRRQAAAVRLGLFRQLVIELSEGTASQLLILSLLKRRDVAALPGARQILPRWIRPLIAVAEDEDPMGVDGGIVEEPRPTHKSKRARKKVKESGRSTFDRISRRKDAIVSAMERRSIPVVMKYLEELLEDHALHGGTEYAVKSLCDLASKAKKLGMHELQLELTERAIRIRPEDGWAWAQHADALLRKQRYDEAIQAYAKAESYGDSDVVAKTGRAEVLKALGRFDEALKAYDDTARVHPNDVVAKNGRAEVLKALGRFDEALKAYEATFTAYGHDAVTRNGYATILVATGRASEALALLPNERPRAQDDWIAYHIELAFLDIDEGGR